MAEDTKEMTENTKETRSLALTPTWSVATALDNLCGYFFDRGAVNSPPTQSVEEMKEEMMLLRFISLLLTASSSTIANICIPSKFYDSTFAPCTRSEIDED